MLWLNFKDLKLERLSGSFSKDYNGVYIGSYNLPNEFRLKGFYVDYRHFYLEKEPTNIFKFANYLSSLTNSKEYKAFIKREKQNWESDLIGSGWFNYKGKSFKTMEILDIFFNAEIFHNDVNKTEVLLKWMEVFSTDTAKTILFMAINDTIPIIRNIHRSVSKLSKSNMYLQMPNRTLHRLR